MNFFKNILIFQSFLIILANAEYKYDEQEILHRKCSMEKNCNLPYCNCDSAEIPVDISKHYKLLELPQLVVLTIDDDKLDIKSYQVYKKLLESFRNPDNSSIKATFFVSDSVNKTSFCLLRNLYDKNHEIAISTRNYTCPNKRCSTEKDFQPWDYREWMTEILNMRNLLNRYAGIPISDIVGFRAPILEPAADMHYKIISSHNFLYDSSLVINSDDDKFVWPFTFDYTMNSPLSNNGPIQLYPGLWELPIPTYVNLDNKKMKCIKIWEGHCKFERSTKGVAKFMRHHFLRAYYNNRAPVVLHLNADWLKDFVKTTHVEILPGVPNKESSRLHVEKRDYQNLNGVIKFINDTLAFNKDVYFVTAQQAIHWMKILPRLKEQNSTDFVNLIRDEFNLFQNFNGEDQHFDGECKILNQRRPDYDSDESFELEVDDLARKLKADHALKSDSVLAKLQSEILFLNNQILFFLLVLVIILLLIIFNDKFQIF